MTVHRKVLSLSYQAIAIFEQLILSSKAEFPTNVFHKIMGITDVLKKNAYDQNEQTIHVEPRAKLIKEKFIFLLIRPRQYS